jgi:dipeptidyl aminopeptidase/acylaminoacyl peptidase
MQRKFIALLLLITAPALAQAKRPMTIDDLLHFKRVSDPQISPDGKHVVYVVGVPDLEKNTIPASLWIAATDGKSEPRQLTNAPGKKDRHPRWSPDGKAILFESNRSGGNQLWIIGLDGGEARQLTTIATDASNAIWSRDGKHVAFVSAVWPEYSEKPYKESNELNKKRKEEMAKNPVKAKIFTKLFYRHWDEYVEDKRQHLFVLELSSHAHEWQPVGDPRDVTPGDRDAFPTSDTFSTGDNFTFSPDGKYLVFTAVPEKNEAWSTNYDICRVPINGEASGERKPAGAWECLTKDNKAADSGPVFSPDGKLLAFRAQRRPEFEADRWSLLTVPTEAGGAWQGKPRYVTAEFDSWVGDFVWGADGKTIRFVAEQKATTSIFEVTLSSGAIKPLVWGGKEGSPTGTLAAPSLSRDGNAFACTVAAMVTPPEVLVTRVGMGEAGQGLHVFAGDVSHANSSLLAQLDLPKPESVTIPVSGAEMQMWILKPPGFDASKRWPLVYLVHGGPQGAWEDGWSYRWNPQLWAAQGYVVAMPNPRGSTGFGQKYVEEISGDWGGKCYDDLMKGVDYLEKQAYIDKDRMAAAGASFGGYMMNWFAVSTPRFKTLISHCGVWNFDSMYSTTDEIWFDEFEHGGPPWGGNRESYEKFSPHKKAANLGKFKTPMLLIQNDLDFRCPVGQGHELFTALQRQGLESRLINFPDEGHWVLKPKNSEYWHKEVFTWLKKHVAPGGK